MSFVSLKDLPSDSMVNSLWSNKITHWVCCKWQTHNLLSGTHTYCMTAKNSTHPDSLSSCSCSVMKHSSHTDRYSMAILASFLYAFPMAPLLGSNWTTFTTLCGEVKEDNKALECLKCSLLFDGTRLFFCSLKSCDSLRIWVLLGAFQQPKGPL